MVFKELSINDRFDFDRSDFPYSGMEPGPWYKVSARCYMKDTTPFGTVEEAYEHSTWNGVKCQIGSINVEVIKLRFNRNGVISKNSSPGERS